jgi:hypothetical protein
VSLFSKEFDYDYQVIELVTKLAANLHANTLIFMIGIPNSTSPVQDEFIQEIKLLFGISLSVFLFVLFFQPFDLNHLNFNNKLLFIAGLGAITFLMLVFFHLVLPRVMPNLFKADEWEFVNVYLLSALFIILNSVALAFYLRFAGTVSLSMYMMFKVVFISAAAIIVLRFYHNTRELKHQIRLLYTKNNKLNALLTESKEGRNLETIEIYSENKSEKLEIKLIDLVLIKSADNYIEVVYLDNGQFRKKLIRNTLKSIEDMLQKFPWFIRCHRTGIINVEYIDKLTRSYSGYKIYIKGYDNEVSVSRQYLLKVREAFNRA